MHRPIDGDVAPRLTARADDATGQIDSAPTQIENFLHGDPAQQEQYDEPALVVGCTHERGDFVGAQFARKPDWPWQQRRFASVQRHRARTAISECLRRPLVSQRARLWLDEYHGQWRIVA